MWAKNTLLNVKRNTFLKEGLNLYEWKLYGLWNRLVNTTSKLATQHFGPPPVPLAARNHTCGAAKRRELGVWN